MFQDQVFCFTPMGELIALPRGATSVDFAYAVHSEVGDSCVGTKINGRVAQLRTPLKNGDQIEIVTAVDGKPSPTWESFVVTGRARARIRRFVRGTQRAEFARLGQAILEKTYRETGYKPSDAVAKRALGKFDVKTLEDLRVAVGKGELTGAEVLATIALRKGRRSKPPAGAEAGKVVPFRARQPGDDGGPTFPVAIRDLIPGMAVHYANCCHPLPGDRIVGIITTGKGVSVHTTDCETLDSFQETPERWLDVAWDLGPGADEARVGRITLVVSNERGTLGSLTTVIATHLGNINNLKITNRTPELFELVLDIEVSDTRHLSDIIAALRATPAVNSVERARGYG
jgi:GTP pyrophosphokinase